MIKTRFGFALLVFFGGAGLARGDAGCEQRIAATQMLEYPADPATICKQKPSLETQSCLVEVLTKGRGKLRRGDLLEVYGVCRADPRPSVRACLLAGMNRPWDDPAYRSAKVVGSECLIKRKDLVRPRAKTKTNSRAASGENSGAVVKPRR